MGGKEAIRCEIGIRGGIEECERELDSTNDSNGSERSWLVVWRLGTWLYHEWLREGTQAAEAISFAFGGELGFGFEVSCRGQFEDIRGFFGHGLEHSPCLRFVEGHWVCSWLCGVWCGALSAQSCWRLEVCLNRRVWGDAGGSCFELAPELVREFVIHQDATLYPLSSWEQHHFFQELHT